MVELAHWLVPCITVRWQWGPFDNDNPRPDPRCATENISASTSIICAVGCGCVSVEVKWRTWQTKVSSGGVRKNKTKTLAFNTIPVLYPHWMDKQKTLVLWLTESLSRFQRCGVEKTAALARRLALAFAWDQGNTWSRIVCHQERLRMLLGLSHTLAPGYL